MTRRFDTLIDALTLLRRSNGEHIIPLKRYFLDHVAPLDSKYAAYIPDLGRGLAVCPLHDDIRPSMGFLNGDDGRERFNCFGCQSFGHVVDLHRRILALHKSVFIGNTQAAYDLLSLYKIDPQPLEDVVRGLGTIRGTDERTTRMAKREADKRSIRDGYFVPDYARDVVKAVDEGKGLGYINTLVHRMTYLSNSGEDNE